MGRKAKIKKMRQQEEVTANTNKKYDSTEFVQQFAKMGYQLKSAQPQSSANRGNISPEIPQERIEPQL
jgi:predicted fused transcriptional regulator/phosphomethylpyrimidine kinase